MGKFEIAIRMVLAGGGFLILICAGLLASLHAPTEIVGVAGASGVLSLISAFH